MVLQPAADRARARDGKPPRVKRVKVPDRESYVLGGLRIAPGSTREHWEREYDEWERSRGDHQ